MIALKIAWRNLTAARRRTIITVLLGALSSALIMLFLCMNEGSYRGMIKNSVEHYSGYLQLQGAGYFETPSLENLIYEADRALTIAQSVEGVALVARRLEASALYLSDAGAFGGVIVGMEPQKEAQLSRFASRITQGDYLTGEDENAVVLGSVLARKLGVGIGDQLSYLSTATDYATAADHLTVKGIFKSGINSFDGHYGFVSKRYMDPLFLSENIASALIIQPHDPAQSDALARALRQKLHSQPIEVITWQQMNRDLLESIELDRVFGRFMGGVLLAIVFFVIMIYALLAIHVRTREIGILRAIGTTPGGVLKMLLLEAVIAGVMAAALGVAIGAGGVWYLQTHPIPLALFEQVQEEYGDMGFLIEPVLTAQLEWSIILSSAAVVFAIHLLSVLYPAWRVVRLKPIEAIDHV
jgi:ABC-type lipoprotein release transport system permease subunit